MQYYLPQMKSSFNEKLNKTKVSHHLHYIQHAVECQHFSCNTCKKIFKIVAKEVKVI